MRTVFHTAATLSVLASSVLVMSVAAASATDLVNQDNATHIVTLSAGETSKTIEVTAMSEIADACEGCTISIDGADPVEAQAKDIVVIMDGALSIQE